MTVIDPDAQAAWGPGAERSTDRDGYPRYAEYAEYADEDYADDADDEMPLSTRLSIADTLTLGNATCGFMAVYFTTTGVLIPHLTGSEDGGMARHSAATAVVLMLMAAVFDLFDGLVARKLRSSAMGAELDNLSDLISFGLAPAYFVAVWGMVANDAHQRISVVAAIVVLLAVVLRLARFSCVPMRNGMFQGMPGPFGALTVVSVVLLELPFVPTALGILGVAWLMVSRVEYPKPRGRLAVAMLCWIVLSMGLLASWAFDAPGGELLLQTGCALQVVLGAVIPLFATARRVNAFRDNRREARAAAQG
ncbi:CDP-diacylglycerol--serine O-phosphatidyltransferase [Streptomyces sp. WMMB303]|uniref:CDP-diacylglycerol--serine O-phosphatidyltransferase n=1 Tax=Streptomyces sp. WMMB303 TaxID=3034154 RepID=UPI0023EE0CE4|nr:CDP-diacylglycerol--serine O-phosphatidyltransferase [Streptomyces sp. WMMB303]MDF4252669.1 CDP-diacylglycerol--serine O-phosphatidyltransferase [Streptomyces sp. WMMB303]